jgi:hypothetical protein
MSKRRRPSRDALIRDAGPFTVLSLADGRLRIQPRYAGVTLPEGCSRDAELYCPACDTHHIYGLVERMALAERIANVLNSYTKEAP